MGCDAHDAVKYLDDIVTDQHLQVRPNKRERHGVHVNERVVAHVSFQPSVAHDQWPRGQRSLVAL